MHKHWDSNADNAETHRATESGFTEDFCFLVIGLGSVFSTGTRPTGGALSKGTGGAGGYPGSGGSGENTHLV